MQIVSCQSYFLGKILLQFLPSMLNAFTLQFFFSYFPIKTGLSFHAMPILFSGQNTAEVSTQHAKRVNSTVWKCCATKEKRPYIVCLCIHAMCLLPFLFVKLIIYYNNYCTKLAFVRIGGKGLFLALRTKYM